MLRKFFVSALMLIIFLSAIKNVEAGHLEEILARGTIKIGTTGDYIPMSYLNKKTGEYEGIDAEISKIIAESLGVKIEYIPTTWKTLSQDTLENLILHFAEFPEIMRVRKFWRCLTVTALEFSAKLFYAENPTRKNLNRLQILIKKIFA